MVGVVVGVGLFCGVLFFVDGLSASMTQRAVEPLPIDMQRILSQRLASGVRLTSSVVGSDQLAAGERTRVVMEVSNSGDTAAHDVTVRSVPVAGLSYVPGTARLDGRRLPDAAGNPFASGPARAGHNLGAVPPGERRRLSYQVVASAAVIVDATSLPTTYSSRESVSPIRANQPPPVPLDELAVQLEQVAGIAQSAPLAIADLGVGTLNARGQTIPGPAKIFGFDQAYAGHDDTIDVVAGSLGQGAALSAEAAEALRVGLGDRVTVELPDGTTLTLKATAIADLSRSRSLFSSRRGGDLETFIYAPYSIVVPPETFASTVLPAFERAAADGAGRLKAPPIQEVDLRLDRELLAADPSTAAQQTERIGAAVMAVAEHQDYLLDNISNTLQVASADAAVAKRLFVFLGVPGALLAAMLSAYAGNVMAEAQRREQAILRVRGASRADLRRMLALRTTVLTGVGAVLGLVAGYLSAVAVLGAQSLARASNASLVASAAIGTLGGFAATGLALYLTGRRSLDREIAEDRAQLSQRAPLWQRARVDLVTLAVVVVGTGVAVTRHSFDGAAGSVYFGRGVTLSLWLLVLPLAMWVAGSLFAARLVGRGLAAASPASTPHLGRLGGSLFRRSMGRRPGPVSTATAVVALVVALASSLAVFTASYDAAKVADARFANGSDLRITPSPAATRTFGPGDGRMFETASVAATSPVIYGLSNVVIRSDRTSDPANIAAVDPESFLDVAPVEPDASAELRQLSTAPGTVLVSRDMAAFLKAKPGDTVHLLLVRATPDQTEVALVIGGLYERLPGFPDGVDAVMNLAEHSAAVPSKAPDFFLAATWGSSDAALSAAVSELRSGPGTTDHLQVDTRLSTLDRDQSSLAALNIVGLVALDSMFALAMAVVALAIFVFGLLLHRRREFVTLRAQGLSPRVVSGLIGGEAATVAAAGVVAGLLVGVAMGDYFVLTLRPLFVLDPTLTVRIVDLGIPASLTLTAAAASAALGSWLVHRLRPTELLRDD